MISKTRPALIIQNNVANEYSPITIVAAITSKFDDNLFPTEVEIYTPNMRLENKFSRSIKSSPFDR